MNTNEQKNIDFTNIYKRSYRLSAAVFLISNVINQNDELKTKIKNLSLNLVSASVSLKDTNLPDSNKTIGDIEKISLELMSMLDIASVAGLVSTMNASILKEEFQSFISELANFSHKSEINKNVSVRSIFNDPQMAISGGEASLLSPVVLNEKYGNVNHQKETIASSVVKNGSTNKKRKDTRKNAILEFIKGHDNTSIKDIVPNITGCSEKTIQRELIALIKEGKIKKDGERRWSRYSVAHI